MSMKLLNFKIMLIATWCYLISMESWAQNQEYIHTLPTDTLHMGYNRKKYRYDHRIDRYHKVFNALIPTHSKLQFYGDIGLISVGFGWDYGKHAQWETDILFGIIPKYNSNATKITMTLKQTYIPWSIYLGKNFSVEPLICGLYLNTVFSDDFWTHEPDRYPDSYYGFSTRIRIHIFAGQSFTYDIPHDKRLLIKAISAFYEISSCDLYIVSACTNSYLKPKDYLRLSFGLKFQIF